MRLSELLESGLQPFTDTTTEMPEYDNYMNNPEYAEYEGFDVYKKWISPDEYIAACAQGFKSTVDSLINSRNTTKVSDYAAKMKAGETFPMLMIRYGYKGSFTQEGLHRAIAAKSIGVETLPVLVAIEKD